MLTNVKGNENKFLKLIIMKQRIRYFCLTLLVMVAGLTSAQDMGYVAQIGDEQKYNSLAEAFEAATDGQTITVLTDIDLPSTIAVTKKVTLDLEGKKIFNTSDLWAKEKGNWSFFSVQAGGNLTVTGNGTIDAKENDCYTFDVRNGGILTIKNGTFKGNISCVYLIKEAETGVSTCNIEGGTFSIKQLANTDSDKYRYLLNCHDASYAGNMAKFNVTGGSFVNFNPANNLAEGEATNFCAAGYEAVQDGDAWTVQKAPVAKIDDEMYYSLADAFAAATDGATITLLKDVELADRLFVNAGATPDYAGTNNRYATTTENKSITLDLNGNNVTSSSNIALAGGSLNIVNKGAADEAHGVISTSASGLAPIEVRGTGDLTSKRALTIGENVTLKGSGYGLNIFGSNDAQKNDIEVNVNGKVEGTLFVLGNLKNTDNNVVVNVNGSVTEATGAGVSLNGFATVNVAEKAVVEGNKLGIEVRAGNLNVAGGTITSKAEEYTVSSNGSGSAATGAAISVAQHTTGLPINANITGCKLSGVKSISVSDPENKNLEGVTVKVADALANVETVVIPEGYKWVIADGMSTLTKKEYVAQVGDVKYETLRDALDAAKDNENIVVELLADATLDVTAWSGTKNPLAIGTESTKSITINGKSHTLTFNQKNSDWNNIATMNDDVTKLVLNNMAITNSGYDNGTWNSHDINFNCAVELNNVTSDKALAFKNDASLKNVTVTETGDVYAIWVQPHGQNISIDGLTINAANGRGIKIDDQYVDNPEKVTLDIANATFNTTKKAGVLVKSKGGAEISVGEGINIDNVTADNVNLVWVDEDSAEEFYKVTVEGATIMPESNESDYVACLMKGEQRWGFYKVLSKAIDKVEDGYSIKLHKTTAEAVKVSKPLTITKNGFTADNVTAGDGFKKFETEAEIVIKAFNPVCAIGDEKYESLQEAVNAAGTAETTITLLTEAAADGVISGAGVVVPSGSNITFDLNGLTYDVSGETVGSPRTETNGFQLLKNSNITFKNGTLKATSPTAQMLIQNYSNLTLEDVNLDGTTLSGWAYALSNNCGTVNLTGSTSITAKEGGRAFDTCKFGSYAIPTVNVNTTGTISGPIEATGGKLNIENGKFDVTWVTDNNYAAGDIQIKGGVFTAEVDEEYCAKGFVCTDNDDPTYKYTVKTKEDAGIFELVHGEPYPYPGGKAAQKVTYRRTFTGEEAGHYRCWYVPFDYTIQAEDMKNFDFYKIHMIAGSGNTDGGVVEDNTQVYIYIEKVKAGTKLRGNRPYVIRPKSAMTNYIFTANDITEIYPENNESRLHQETTEFEYDYYGTYREHQATGGHEFISLNKDGQTQWNKSKDAKLQSYVWYIKVTSRGDIDYAKTNIFFVDIDDDTTDIFRHQVDSNDVEGVYTVSGAKVEKPVKGVNIIRYKNGTTKKIYVK